MINIRGLLDLYDWLGKQPGDIPKLRATILEEIIFDDLIYREKRYLGNGQIKPDHAPRNGCTKDSS